MAYPEDLTEDEAYDAAAEVDFQITDVAVAAARAIEEGNFEKADSKLREIRSMAENMKEAAEIGGLERWIEYADGLSEHVEQTRNAIEEGRGWDAFDNTVEIPELCARYTTRPYIGSDKS